MFSCAHRACMVVYSTAACNTCPPMTSAERMRKPQLQSTDLWPETSETQFSKRAVTFLEMTDLGPSFPVRGLVGEPSIDFRQNGKLLESHKNSREASFTMQNCHTKV